jgi:uncharacterized SAM-binding protein YcdF (DUF218 family)
MSIYFDKIIALITYPLGVGILLVVAGIALSLAGRRFVSTLILITAVTVLWIFSTPLVSRILLSNLENGNSSEQISADVAILLGGIMRGQDEKSTGPDLTDAADRVIQAFRLFRNGRVKYILVTGGNPPWSSDSIPEARHIAELLKEWGTPSHAIIVEDQSRNTWENAMNSKGLWDKQKFKSGLLVTSAAHIPRALAVFRRAGFSVTPAAADFRARPYFEGGILAILPDAQALEDSTIAIKEWIGRGVYHVRGWI